MTHTEESVKLYWTKNPNCLIPHLDTIREIEAKSNLYEKKLEAGKQVLQQMMDTAVKELDHVRYEEVNLIQLP